MFADIPFITSSASAMNLHLKLQKVNEVFPVPKYVQIFSIIHVSQNDTRTLLTLLRELLPHIIHSWTSVSS
jgi:hypothetical protein